MECVEHFIRVNMPCPLCIGLHQKCNYLDYMYRGAGNILQILAALRSVYCA